MRNKFSSPENKNLLKAHCNLTRNGENIIPNFLTTGNGCVYLKDEWARKTMLPEHCDVVVFVAAVSAVVLAAVVVVSEDMVDDVGSSGSSVIAPPGVQPRDPREAPRGPPRGRRDNYCFGYCSSCLDAVTCDNHLLPFAPLPAWGLPRVPRGPLLLQRGPPLNPAYPDAPGVVMASYPNEASYHT